MNAAAAVPEPDAHTWTAEELRAQLGNTRRRRARTDRTIANAAALTDRLAAVNDHPDHVIAALRAIIQGG